MSSSRNVLIYVGIGLAILVGILIFASDEFPPSREQARIDESSDEQTLSVGPMSGVAPLSVSFAVRDDMRSAHSVDFGDGSRALISDFTCGLQFCSMSHGYVTPGTYTAVFSDSSGVPVRSFVISVAAPAGDANAVRTAQDFSFTLPHGWSVSEQKTLYGDTQVTILKGPMGTVGIQVECPPIGKGYENEVRVSASNRLFTHTGTTYAVSYTELVAQNALGERTSDIPDLIFVSLYPAPAVDTLTHNPSNQVCLAAAKGSVDAQTVAAMKDIATSWK